MSADFLVEIGTEELPPKALLGLSEAFQNEVVAALEKAQLRFGNIRPFAAPRRLALYIASVDEKTPSTEIVNWGPPAKVAFNSEGSLTKAGKAFAAKNGLDPASLKDLVENDGSQEKLCFRTVSEGVATASLLGEIVESALAKLPIPKRMRWGASREEFVRPVHWVVMLFGNDVVDTTVLSLPADRISRGHRFHSQGPVSISSPAAYADELKAAHVIADFAERREIIRQGVASATEQAGGTAVIDDDLLNEVTALNEWPVPLIGRFEQRFLEVPPEALISSMKEHQKYFHVVDDKGSLLPMFITVANIESRDPAQVVEGNERVIRPRLSDAAFFYKTDRKKSLEARRDALKSIVFQEKLGTLYDKSVRVAQLADYLSDAVGASAENALRSGQLCKSDLVTEMVLEFDDLQGIMGRYYARNDGESDEVAEAMYEQYLPRFAGDQLPETATGTALALADRLDTLVGIFGIGQPPSGSRDPFALRRASLGVLRIIVEKGIDLSLRDTLAKAASLHTGISVTTDLCEQVLTYLLERFRAWYEDDGIAANVFLAVQAKDLDNPLDFHLRVQAIHHFNEMPEASALAVSNKRVSNILAKSAGELPNSVEASLFESDTEAALFKALGEISSVVHPLFESREYSGAMQQLAALKQPVDDFFDNVMVMAEDDRLRMNRLRLLSDLRELFLNVADISHLVPAK